MHTLSVFMHTLSVFMHTLSGTRLLEHEKKHKVKRNDPLGIN